MFGICEPNLSYQVGFPEMCLGDTSVDVTDYVSRADQQTYAFKSKHTYTQ